ncbi:MAG: hypothetical protein U1C86_02330, partial [Hydrogenophaga sp.]|nr:hypothetical protein [Hydrogenophaga sp.]
RPGCAGTGDRTFPTRRCCSIFPRGELVVLGERSLQKIVRPVHFLSVRTTDRARAPVVAFVDWVRAQVA